MHIAFPLLLLALLTGVLVLAGAVSYTDYRYRRIPNKFLLIALLYALLIFAMMATQIPFKDVSKGFLFSVLGMLVGWVLLYPAYMLKQVAAGDVKLLMVFGFYLGPKGAMLALLNGAIIGGIWALFLAWRIGGLGHLFYNIKFMARSAYLTGFKEMGWDLRQSEAVKMPYGIALAVGAVSIALWQMSIKYKMLMQALQHTI